MTPSKRSPVSGSSAETMGLCSLTSRRMWAATMRTMRSVSAAPRRSPLSSRPMTARSIHRRPSGLTITSMTVGSASAAAMLGPKAVRSICLRRPCASSAAALVRISVIFVSCGFGGAVRGFLCCITGSPIETGCKGVRLVACDAFEHLSHEPPIGGQAAADLGDELLETLAPQQPRRLLFAFGQRRGDGEEVAHEQRQRFAGDGLIASEARDGAVEGIEPVGQSLRGVRERLWLEQRLQRLFYQGRLA